MLCGQWCNICLDLPVGLGLQLYSGVVPLLGVAQVTVPYRRVLWQLSDSADWLKCMHSSGWKADE